MSDRFPTTLSAIALLSAITAAPMSAQERQTFRACYVPEVGAMYMIGFSGLPMECLSSEHVEIGWSEGGASVADHGALNGLGDDDHPEYVREGEAAAGDLEGAFPDPTVAGLQGHALSSTDPSDGQVLTWNAGTTEWEPQTGPMGETDHGNLDGLVDDDHSQYLLVDGVRDATDGFAVTGTFGSGTIPTEGPGVRLMWYPRRAALRAGRVFGDQWDAANVGPRSTAFGVNTTASGDVATAMGDLTTASGAWSTSMGAGTIASGLMSTAMGRNTTASGDRSTAMGSGTIASGVRSTAMGSRTTASGDFSAAMGRLATAQAQSSLVLGRYNLIEGDPTSWVATDPLFVAGNGSSGSSRSNALTLLKNGNLTIAGTLTESSDARLKTRIEPLGSALEPLRSVRPVRFSFREGTGHPGDRQIGLIAQEVEKAFPELVTRDHEGYLSLAYPKLTAVLVGAIQEQQERIEEWDTLLARLLERIERLEAAVRAREEHVP